MEGTKHEKVVLVVLAYIIGFTTGLIGFGVNQSGFISTDANYSELELGEQEVSVAKSDINSNTDNGDEIVSYKDGRLRLIDDDNTLLLSIDKNLVDEESLDSFTEQGIHTAIPYFIISPDQHYVYFCEQRSTEDACTNFVFDTESSIIQFVSNGGEKLSTTAATAQGVYWNDDGGLVIGDLTSLALDTPWKVAIR